VRPQWWMDDDELFAELGRAHRPREPVTRAILNAAVAAHSWRNLDAELAALTYDSLFDEDLLAPARSTQDTRILTFQSGGIEIEIEIGDAVVRGQLLPPQPGQVVLLTAEGHEHPATANQVGFFTVPVAARTPFRLWCTTADADSPVVTEWTRAAPSSGAPA